MHRRVVDVADVARNGLAGRSQRVRQKRANGPMCDQSARRVVVDFTFWLAHAQIVRLRAKMVKNL